MRTWTWSVERIPEKRPNVIAKILSMLDSCEAYRQDYANGEFISSSLIVSRTRRAVMSRSLELECAENAAHFDSALEVWWRRGGSFD